MREATVVNETQEWYIKLYFVMVIEIRCFLSHNVIIFIIFLNTDKGNIMIKKCYFKNGF
jgi:hypothetical protein